MNIIDWMLNLKRDNLKLKKRKLWTGPFNGIENKVVVMSMFYIQPSSQGHMEMGPQF